MNITVRIGLLGFVIWMVLGSSGGPLHEWPFLVFTLKCER